MVATRSKLWVLLAVIVLLLVGRAAAPPAIEYYLNEHLLWDLGAYSGHVENVDLALWRGTARLENVRIEKVTGTEWVRFLTLPAMEVTVNPLAIFRGVIQTEVLLEQPELNIVGGADEADKQTGSALKFPEDPDADPEAEPLFAVELARLEIQQGMIAFRNFTSEPPVNLPANNINLVATYLTTDPGQKDAPRGHLDVSADLLAGSPFSAEAEYDSQDFQNFTLAADMTFRDLTQFNSFARAYANLDFNSGHGTLAVEVTAQDGQLSGYAKPAFEDVGIFDWEAEMEQADTNPLQLMWEGAADAVTQLFSNRETDTLATRIEIEGDVSGSTEVSTWGAVLGIIGNAFIAAINTTFEHITPLDPARAKDHGADSDSATSEGG